MKTYSITKGNQYDCEGALVRWGSLSAKYGHDGRHLAGNLPSDDIAATIAEVIATGVAQTVTIGEHAAERLEAIGSGWAIGSGCARWTPEQGCPLHGETCHDQD